MSPRSQHDNIHEHEHEILNPLKMCIFVLVFYCSLGCVAVPLTLVFENEINVNLPYLLFFFCINCSKFFCSTMVLWTWTLVLQILVLQRERHFFGSKCHPPKNHAKHTYFFGSCIQRFLHVLYQSYPTIVSQIARISFSQWTPPPPKGSMDKKWVGQVAPFVMWNWT